MEGPPIGRLFFLLRYFNLVRLRWAGLIRARQRCRSIARPDEERKFFDRQVRWKNLERATRKGFGLLAMKNAARLLVVALLLAAAQARAQVGPATLPNERAVRSKVSRLWAATCEETGLDPGLVAGYPLAQATRDGFDIMLAAAFEREGRLLKTPLSQTATDEEFDLLISVFNKTERRKKMTAAFGHIACVPYLLRDLKARTSVTSEEALALERTAGRLQDAMVKTDKDFREFSPGVESRMVRAWLWRYWEWAEEIKKMAKEKIKAEPAPPPTPEPRTSGGRSHGLLGEIEKAMNK